MDTPQADSKDKALAVLRELFQGVDSSKLASIFTEDKRKPAGWANRANAPYYRERFAKELKCVIDAMLKESEESIFEDRFYFYKDFPQYSHNSLYLKINQSKLYLLERLDFDGRYATFFERVSITRERMTGIRISWDRDISDPTIAGEFAAKKVVEKQEQTIIWKDRIENFLEEAKPGQKLYVGSLALSPEEIEDIKTSMSQLNDILCKVTEREIILIKLTPEQMERFK